jgi:hypothetical protein
MGRELERAVGAQDIPLRVLLFASLGPGVAWGLHLNLVYFLTALYCSMGRSGADVAIYIATGVLLGLALFAGWTALRNWRRLGKGARLTDAVSGPSGRTAMLLFIGMASSVLFSLIILVEGLVPMFVRSCSLTGA